MKGSTVMIEGEPFLLLAMVAIGEKNLLVLVERVDVMRAVGVDDCLIVVVAMVAREWIFIGNEALLLLTCGKTRCS
jgi:hypothetical protein